MSDFIEIENLSFWYKAENAETPILKDINLSIKRGEFVAVVGPNGCGKSTLIRHLNGLLIPRRGRVVVDGLDTGMENNLPFIRRKVGMVFQNPDTQLFASVVEEDVAFGLENMCLPQFQIRDRVDEALARVGMSEYRDYPPHRLSGGQKQKAAIAGILAMRPECVILDEPTSMLDPRGKREVMEAVRALNTCQQMTVIYVTHDMTEALYCDRLVALVEGQTVFTGLPGEFFMSPEHLCRAGLRPPAIKELVRALIDAGIEVPTGINSPEELVGAICR
ncbi:MAG: energy-coupling factor transporter ATPase [Firmicutes bacterium HGW-Firmicutes-8]|nr:MAG: energy-coupling factor transporter ATPase [Firmicutes bacterium HGW-Firmicutes-8]